MILSSSIAKPPFLRISFSLFIVTTIPFFITMSAMVVFLQTLKSNHASSFYPLFNVRLNRRIAYLTALGFANNSGTNFKARHCDY
jgi:hypothetical protein